MKNRILYTLLIALTSCQSNEKGLFKTKESTNLDCELPLSISNYIKKHNSHWILVTSKEFSLNGTEVMCPFIARGDFNDNGKEDLAIIVRDKTTKLEHYKNKGIPQLVIFHDYLVGIKEPTIVIKTGTYKQDDSPSVIYDQMEEGIVSYIKKNVRNGKDEIEIVIPEKSTFFVSWLNSTKSYIYFNHLDDYSEIVKSLDNPNETVYCHYSSLFVGGIEYKDLIVNAMSLSTSLNIIDDNEFNLCYNYSASATKTFISYKFRHDQAKTSLIFKEIVQKNSEGISINRIYFKNINLANCSIEKLEELGAELENNFLPQEAPAELNVYNQATINVATIKLSISGSEYFIEGSSENCLSKFSSIMVQDITELNNVAFYVGENRAHNEAIFLLEKVLKVNPQRTVAYLNLADAFWEIDKKSQAREHYLKYVSLMKKNGLEVKIPSRVKMRTK